MNHSPLHFLKHSKRGFTLVETLVAITILTLAILAPFDAVERVINSSRLAKDQLIASSLAQEALEYVRFFRTSNYLANQNPGYDAMWGMDGVPGSRFNTSSSGTIDCRTNLCTIDGTLSTIGTILGTCSGSSIQTCNALNLITTGGNAGMYTQTSGGTNTATIFRRGFSYKQNVSGSTSYETVTVTVQWVDHGTQTMVLTENLYDWF